MKNKLIKLFYLASISLSITMQAMEQAQEVQQIGWDNIPLELKSYILSLIPDGTSMREIVKSLRSSSMVNRELRDLVKNLLFNPEAVDYLAKKYATTYKSHAMLELYYAIKDGNLAVAKALIDSGVINLNSKELNSSTYLICAVENQEIEIVKMLLNARADVNSQNACSWTPLMSTCSKYIGELLLKSGANVNAKNNSGNTELIMAVRSCNKDKVELLLNYSADPIICNNSGDSALIVALELLQSRASFKDDESLKEIIDMLEKKAFPKINQLLKSILK